MSLCANAHRTLLILTLSLCCSRREVHSAPILSGLSSDSEHEEEEEEEEDIVENDDAKAPDDNTSTASSDSSHGEEDTGTA